MAALTQKGAKTCHGTTTSTTAETFGLTQPVKRLDIVNRDTDPCYVTLTLAATDPGDTDAGLTTAVAAADETFVVPPISTVTIFRSPRAAFVRGSIIGNASPYSIQGYDWY